MRQTHVGDSKLFPHNRLKGYVYISPGAFKPTRESRLSQQLGPRKKKEIEEKREEKFREMGKENYPINFLIIIFMKLYYTINPIYVQNCKLKKKTC